MTTWQTTEQTVTWTSTAGTTWQVVRGSTSGGGGVTVHNDLTGRTASDAHPTSAVTGLDAALAGKAATVHSHATSDVTGLDEQVRDVVGTALVAGSNVSITVGDPADTITIAASGDGGGYSTSFLLMGG